MVEKPWDIDLTVYKDEAALLEGLRRGDRFACTCLLKRYAPRLYRLAFQLTGHADEAEDVLQESFIEACDHVGEFQGRSRLGTWLHRIVLNTALMHLRRRVVSQSLDAVGAERPQPAAEVADSWGDPSEAVEGQEIQAAIDRAVLGLPDTLRAAFVLRDIEGLSTREAARALGITESALKVRLHRARLAVRQALAPYVASSTASRGGQR